MSRFLAFFILLSFSIITLHHTTHDHDDHDNEQNHCIACLSQLDNVCIENDFFTNTEQVFLIFNDSFFIKNNLFISNKEISQIYLRAPPVNQI